MTTTTDTAAEPEIIPAGTPLPTPADAEPTLPELARIIAIADVIEKGAKDRIQPTRGAVLRKLNELRVSTGIKQMDVLLDPNDPASKVATISLTGGDAKFVVSNQRLYTAWVEENYPDEVEYTATVRESFQKAHLGGLEVEGDVVYDPRFHEVGEDGTVVGGVVDGVRHVPASEPTGITLRFVTENAKKKQANGRAIVMSEITGQSLAALLGADARVIDAVEG